MAIWCVATFFYPEHLDKPRFGGVAGFIFRHDIIDGAWLDQNSRSWVSVFYHDAARNIQRMTLLTLLHPDFVLVSLLWVNFMSCITLVFWAVPSDWWQGVRIWTRQRACDGWCLNQLHNWILLAISCSTREGLSTKACNCFEWQV
jgi:hypothetical protein